MLYMLLLCMALVSFAACDNDDNRQIEESIEQPSVTLITSIGGLGDNAYNDLIMSGIMQFGEEHPEVALSVRVPSSYIEVEELLTTWIEEGVTTGDKNNRLLILGGTEYTSILQNAPDVMDTRSRILLVEGDSATICGGGHCAVHVVRYGAAYLIGCLVREVPQAFVLAACPGDTIVGDAIAGFHDGYLDASNEKGVFEIHYLSDDATGYSMPNAAYRWTSSLYNVADSASDYGGDKFVLPLAGGSNNGVYKYTREHDRSLLLVCGMDVDASAYSSRIPFSMLVHIDKVLFRLLNEWADSGMLATYTCVGLEDKDAIEVLLNPTFYEDLMAWQSYYENESYWEEGVNRYLSTALAKESVHEAKR